MAVTKVATRKPKRTVMSAVEKTGALEQEIKEGNKRIRVIDKKIEKLNVGLVKVLSEQHIEADLEAIEAARAGLQEVQAVLSRRIEAMRVGLPSVRAGIDREALSQAVEAYPSMVEESNRAVIAWRALMASLPDLAEAAKTVRETSWALLETTDKIRYLEYLTDGGHADLTAGENIPEKETDSAQAAFQEGTRVTRFPRFSFKQTVWRTKLEELRTKRQRTQAQERDRAEYERQTATNGVQLVG